MLRGLLRLLGLAKPQVPCWCGSTHDLGYWHDPTHGRIDRDIQEHARDLFDFPAYATRLTMGEQAIHVHMAEIALQKKRDEGELLYWQKPEQRA